MTDVLVRVSVTVKRLQEHTNSYKEIFLTGLA